MATEAQKEYYRKWRQRNKARVRSYEDSRREKTNSRKRARRKMERIYGKAALKGKSVDHKDHNPKNNSKGNLRIRKNYHGFEGRKYKRRG